MSTTLTLYGGVNKIGGNKILLKSGKTRVFFDMGQSFDFGEEFFTGYLMDRTSRFGLRDLLFLGLIPRIPGLYSKEMLEFTDLKYEPSRYQGVFLTHAHFDHTWHSGYVDEQIPIYLGEGTKIILDAWKETSSTPFRDGGYRTFRTGKVIGVDSMEVEPIHVDHSVPAAYGYLIHTEEGTIAYTGDLRHHGTHAHLTYDFIEKSREAKPDVLICEGTRVTPHERRKNYSEREVKAHSKEVVRNAKGKLVVTTFYPKDVDRMKTFYEVAVETGRKFVVSTKTAYLLNALRKDPGIEVPDIGKDENILIYLRRLKSRRGWERQFEDCSVDSEYVRKNQKNLILQLDFQHFNEFIDIQPKPGSHFIHSMSEPFEENDIEDEVKHNWIDFFRLHFHQYHASGHCSMEEIKELIHEINPKKVVPIHTEYPRLFKRFSKRVIVPELQKEYEL